MRARYVNRLTPDDVGERVSIRRWVEDPERGARPSDVVGHLEAWEDGTLLVRRRDDQVVEVYEADILSAKVIPPAPPPRRPTRDA